MNLCFATIGGGYPWPPSRRCSGSVLGVSPRPITRSGAPPIFRGPTPRYWGLLKQPDKQKTTIPAEAVCRPRIRAGTRSLKRREAELSDRIIPHVRYHEIHKIPN